jgi:hypothetical protein
MEVSDQLHAPTALIPEIQHAVPIEWEGGWVSELFWVLWKGEKYLAPVWNRTPSLLTKQSRLVYLENIIKKFIRHKIYILFSFTTFSKYFGSDKYFRDSLSVNITNVHRFPCKVSDLWPDSNHN